MLWSKFPSAWLRAKDKHPLEELKWSEHRTQGTASLVLLIALSIRLNLSHKSVPVAERKPKVAVTYKEFEDLTGFARATISKALMLLEGMGAITTERVGRRVLYGLPQTAVPGEFCQLPQQYLLDGKEAELRRLKNLPTNRRACLNAMKLYVLFLAHRNVRWNTTAIGYEAIMKQTGMRREDIPEAFSLLVAHELARATDADDDREQDKSKRYRILGLYSMSKQTVVHIE